MPEYTFESPVALLTHLYAGEDSPDGICRAPSALFGWYSRAKRVYDPILCKSCKQKISREEVEQQYREIINYNSTEKTNAVLAVGGAFTLKMNGEILGKVEASE